MKNTYKERARVMQILSCIGELKSTVREMDAHGYVHYLRDFSITASLAENSLNDDFVREAKHAAKLFKLRDFKKGQEEIVKLCERIEELAEKS